MHERSKTKSRHSQIDLTFHVLRATAEAFEIMHSLQGKDRWIAVHQGTEGLRRVQQERYACAVRKRLAILKHRRLIVETKQGHALTDSGKELFAKKRIRNAPQLTGARWLAVVFDIPERSRSSRDGFRRFLRATGFVRVQHSVWVTRRDAREALRELVRQRGFGDWVKIWLIEVA